MNRGLSPKAVIIMGLCVIVVFIIAFFVKRFLPINAEWIKSLIFWIIIIAGAAISGIIVGKKFGKG